MTDQLHAEWFAKQLEWEQAILATFRSATPDIIVEGKRWYPEAQKTLRQLATEAGIEINTKRLAAVCAVLSPRITWASNIDGVRRILASLAKGESNAPTVSGTYSNVAKSWKLATGSPFDLVSGPKVKSFFANLSGDFSRVTLDVWAGRAAGIEGSELAQLRGNRYDYLERAYQTVAAELGFKPAELQAICWIVVRGKGE